MKCPRCWAEKAYLRQVKGWRGVVLAVVLLRPMKCHHCYHKFVVPWISTIGHRVTPPTLRAPSANEPVRLSYAAQLLGVAQADAAHAGVAHK